MGSKDPTRPFSAAQTRAGAARTYLFVVQPAITAFIALLLLASWLVEPSDVPVDLWVVFGAMCVLVVLYVVVVRLGADPLPIAGVSFVAAAAIEVVAMFSSPEPVGTSASITCFVVAASYFLGAWEMVAFSAAAATAITIASQRIDAWGEAYFIPSTAIVVLFTGTLCAYIMSRVRATEQRLERVAADERATRERLEQVDRSRDRLITNVSHELRTPLTATIGSIETLLRDDVEIDEASRAGLMRVARDGGLRLLALVEDLLTLGATRPDSLELEAEPEHLVRLARDAIAGIDPGEDRSIVIDGIDDPLVQVDRLRMLQVVGNLVINALRHGAGDVVIEVQRQGTEAIVRVLDDGAGVDPAHTGELFLPFARFSTRPDSTGLGLAICRTIVEAHGGHIGYVRSSDDRTCFWMRLPLDRAA